MELLLTNPSAWTDLGVTRNGEEETTIRPCVSLVERASIVSIGVHKEEEQSYYEIRVFISKVTGFAPAG
jgi:hypothetical protein